MHELGIPTAVKKAPQANEILRVWVAGDSQHVSLAAEVWDDPAAWGLCLVDLARHISRAYEKRGHMSAADALERLRQGFDAEWDSPTDVPGGDLV